MRELGKVMTMFKLWKVTFTSMKSPEEDSFQDLSWLISNQVFLDKSNLVLRWGNYSTQTISVEPRMVQVITGLRDTIVMVLKLLRRFLIKSERTLKCAKVFKDSKWCTHWVEELAQVWDRFYFRNWARSIQIEWGSTSQSFQDLRMEALQTLSPSPTTLSWPWIIWSSIRKPVLPLRIVH